MARPTKRYPLLDEPRDHLSRVRALLRQAQAERGGSLPDQAVIELESALHGSQKAGLRYLVLMCLLTRAELYRARGDLVHARTDLEKVLFVTTRYGLSLHEADCHLGFIHLQLAEGDLSGASEKLARVRQRSTAWATISATASSRGSRAGSRAADEAG